MTKCYYCGKAGGHAPGCNERPELADRNPCKDIDIGEHMDIRAVRANGTKQKQKQQVADAVRKAVEATVGEMMSPEQVKAALEALKSWPDLLKVDPHMRDAWVYGSWDVTPETEHLRKPIKITRLKFKDP